jgi:hypothetical protein
MQEQTLLTGWVRGHPATAGLKAARGKLCSRDKAAVLTGVMVRILTVFLVTAAPKRMDQQQGRAAVVDKQVVQCQQRTLGRQWAAAAVSYDGTSVCCRNFHRAACFCIE